MPFKNLFNEWFVLDTSRKIRAVQRAKAQRGERLGTRAPYGYKKDENNKGKLIIAEEATEVVRRIFSLCAAGRGTSQIARQLSEEKVLCPSMYAYKRFGITHTGLDVNKPCNWDAKASAELNSVFKRLYEDSVLGASRQAGSGRSLSAILPSRNS